MGAKVVVDVSMPNAQAAATGMVRNAAPSVRATPDRPVASRSSGSGGSRAGGDKGEQRATTAGARRRPSLPGLIRGRRVGREPRPLHSLQTLPTMQRDAYGAGGSR